MGREQCEDKEVGRRGKGALLSGTDRRRMIFWRSVEGRGESIRRLRTESTSLYRGERKVQHRSLGICLVVGQKRTCAGGGRVERALVEVGEEVMIGCLLGARHVGLLIGGGWVAH